MELLGNLKNSVVNAWNNSTSTSPPVVSKSDVLGLEETERSRRMTQVSQTKVDKENAANVSGLIRSQSFPVFRGNVSRGINLHIPTPPHINIFNYITLISLLSS